MPADDYIHYYPREIEKDEKGNYVADEHNKLILKGTNKYDVKEYYKKIKHILTKEHLKELVKQRYKLTVDRSEIKDIGQIKKIIGALSGSSGMEDAIAKLYNKHNITHLAKGIGSKKELDSLIQANKAGDLISAFNESIDAFNNIVIEYERLRHDKKASTVNMRLRKLKNDVRKLSAGLKTNSNLSKNDVVKQINRIRSEMSKLIGNISEYSIEVGKQEIIKQVKNTLKGKDIQFDRKSFSIEVVQEDYTEEEKKSKDALFSTPTKDLVLKFKTKEGGLDKEVSLQISLKRVATTNPDVVNDPNWNVHIKSTSIGKILSMNNLQEEHKNAIYNILVNNGVKHFRKYRNKVEPDRRESNKVAFSTVEEDFYKKLNKVFCINALAGSNSSIDANEILIINDQIYSIPDILQKILIKDSTKDGFLSGEVTLMNMTKEQKFLDDKGNFVGTWFMDASEKAFTEKGELDRSDRLKAYMNSHRLSWTLRLKKR